FPIRAPIDASLLSLHDALPICLTALEGRKRRPLPTGVGQPADPTAPLDRRTEVPWLEPLPDDLVWGGRASNPSEDVISRDSIRLDRKSTRLNSSHVKISYAVFC